MFASARAEMDRRGIPGDPGLPLLGYSLHSIGLFGDPIHFLRARWQKYGAVSWLNGFGRRWLVLLGPDANQFAYQNRGGVCSNDAWTHFLANFFNRGLMLLDGPEHKLHRHIMQHAFKRDALAHYVDEMGPMIAQTLGQWTTGEGVQIYPRFKALTLDVAAKVFMDRAPDAEIEQVNRAFLATVRAPTDILRLPIPFTRWHRGISGRQVLERFFRDALPAHRATERPDLFSRLCHARDENDATLSDDDVINHMIFLMMAAHDTSTITLTNMTYQLAKHPTWQEQLREESRALRKTVLSYEDLFHLPAMDLVLREALRMCAPVPGMPRRLTQECEFDGYALPAGEYVQLSPWFAHFMPEYWHAPERFDPERFASPREEHKQHPFLWVPFGGGAHKCIGMHFGELEIRQVLHQMLLRYRWTVPEDYVIRQDFTSLPIPRDKLPVRLEAL